MHRSAVAPLYAVAAACLALGACGSSGKASGSAHSAPTPEAATTPAIGGRAGFPGSSICAAVPDREVRKVIAGPSGQGTPAEIKKGVHACAWTAQSGKRAFVAVIFDDSFDKKFVHDDLALANGAAKTHFPVSVSTNFDQGARNVSLYALGTSRPLPAYSTFSDAAATLTDFIYNADHAAGG